MAGHGVNNHELMKRDAPYLRFLFLSPLWWWVYYYSNLVCGTYSLYVFFSFPSSLLDLAPWFPQTLNHYLSRQPLPFTLNSAKIYVTKNEIDLRKSWSRDILEHFSSLI